MEKCPHCPLRGEALPCPARTLPHERYCTVTDPGSPEYHAGFADIIRRRASLPIPAPPVAAGAPRANRSLDLLGRMKACPHFEPRSDCGCGVNRCRIGRGRAGLVSHADCMACLEATPAPVAAVVISHDYGRFLAEALESVLAQEARPAEVLVVDDASTDDTAEVAARFADRGVRYLRVDHGDVFRARAAGLAATAAPYVAWLDADDVWTADYLARGLGGFADPAVAIVYSDVEHFGDRIGRSNYPAFDRGRLERSNYLHAGSIARRVALEHSGAFEGAPPPSPAHADWYTWRRVIDAGWRAAKSPALYRYRQHSGSMLATGVAVPYYVSAALERAEVTLCVALSGRAWAWPALREWLERQTWPRGQCRLVLLDTSQDGAFGAEVRGWLAGSDYPDARYRAAAVAEPGLADRPRAENAGAVRAACSRIYSALALELATPWAMVVEDDVTPPPDAIGRLLRAMREDVAYVAAPYRSRFQSGYVAWDEAGAMLRGGAGVSPIGGSGFGATLIRRAALAGETFVPTPAEAPDYDTAFAARLRRKGWRLLADWGAEARHLGAPGV